MEHSTNKISLGGLLIAIGIVFGDIGTSPLYVFTAITGGNNFDETLILGSMSCIFWTLILLATTKYVYLALNADNQGEGGIFALYALLRKTNSKWIIFPALIGCATLISDGFITPAISISSAVEGLNEIFPSLPTLPIVVVIITCLFFVQQFGTQAIGKLFGPVMLLWFLTLGVLGVNQLIHNPSVFVALNPMYAIQFLVAYPGAIWVLGAVFLCTTGAEAMYSDLGHCGKQNIRRSWIFVLSMLLLNYFGQAAFCLSGQAGKGVDSVFYATVPPAFLPFAIGIATVAAIIASQALITGVFTLVNEAIKLRLWTTLKVKYPSAHKGQVYIPFINYFLLFGCLTVIWIFKKSTNMEAAYGLAITVDMLMTTLLLGYLLVIRNKSKKYWFIALMILFALIESIFLLSNLGKLAHGGWFSLLLAACLFILLFFYYKARQLRLKVAEYVPFRKVLPILKEVMNDPNLAYEATNIVYPARSISPNEIDATIVYSLFNKKPRKAKMYWFLHVDITDVPWGVHYSLKELIPKRSYYVSLQLGFKEEHLVEHTMKKIHSHLVKINEISGESVFESVSKYKIPPDFKFILLNSRVSNDNQLSPMEQLAIRVYRFIKSVGWSTIDDFGLDKANVEEEYVPIKVTQSIEIDIQRQNPIRIKK